MSEIRATEGGPATYAGRVRQEQTRMTLMTKDRPAEPPSGSTAASSAASAAPSALLVAVALGIVYVVWGSTYLAIRVTVHDLPAMSSASWRYGAAGVILAAILVVRSGWSVLRVGRVELAGAALLGLLLPTLGNGLVSVGEQHGAPSGIAALIVAAVPLWVIVYRAVAGDRPRAWTTAGVLLGFVGLVGLIASTGLDGDVAWGACLVIVVATVCWSFGSWSTPRLRLPRDPFVTTTYEMLCGSVFLFVGGLVRGEDVVPHAAPLDSWLAWSYLVTFGSVVAFTAYVWVLSVAPISLVATYAYVNPVVAVFLGWLILSEQITTAILVAGFVVVAAVAIVVSSERKPKVTSDDDQRSRDLGTLDQPGTATT
jgi:drug/metabolite transporter (DMT)-like permease